MGFSVNPYSAPLDVSAFSSFLHLHLVLEGVSLKLRCLSETSTAHSFGDPAPCRSLGCVIPVTHYPLLFSYLAACSNSTLQGLVNQLFTIISSLIVINICISHLSPNSASRAPPSSYPSTQLYLRDNIDSNCWTVHCDRHFEGVQRRIVEYNYTIALDNRMIPRF
jgi:hypothetical protein